MELATLKFYNVIVLGFAFMLMFTGFQTCGMIEQTVLNSYKNETKVNGTVTYHGDGYTSLAIIYIVFAFANWLAPSVVSLLGAKYSMVFGGITYTLYLSSFIKPVTATLYIGSVLIGIGAAVLWTGQGAFLTMNSDEVTMGRNSGIFWAMLQCSLLIGNIYVFFAWQGVTTILDHQRIPLYIALTSVCALGTALLFILMRQPTQPPEVDDETTDENQVEVREKSPLKEAWEALLDSVRLFMTPNMMILSITFFYTGLELTFFSGVYTTAVGATKMFGEDSDKLVGLTGIMIGVGEILGGALFGIFGKKLTRYGRDPVVLLGGVVHLASFFLIFINIPDDAPIHGTHDQAYIYPNQYLAVSCGFLLGLADACFNTQCYAIIGTCYPDNSAPAFALFKFEQSLAAAIGFFYSSHLALKWQLLILVVFAVGGTSSFFVVERKTRRSSSAVEYSSIE
uniref:UNC93-like protein MFSD11 isoform X1 n=1 Tax=Ciona intestinalis TaxID=7719 RepID=UPI000180B480|nr:UNC93-like protein MFSD11 isoform X1 [Ciona intestinalis]|eukprot:XP_002126089.1 UNC93-like protein MFSD11 isoform X1 [Ciona intestinalis]